MNTGNESFSMPLLTEQQVLTRHEETCQLVWRNRAIVFGIALAVVVSTYFFSGHAPKVVLCAFVYVFVVAVIVWLMVDLEDAFIEPRSPWMPDSCCNQLSELCESTPELIPYRDQVRALGRRFTVEEFGRMRDWTPARYAREHLQRDEAEYVRLYGRPRPAEK